MRAVALAWGLAGLGLWLAGTAAPWLPRGVAPDPGLLMAVAIGLRLGGLRGLVAAWGLGWACDLLSGAALGQYALLHLVAWALTRIGQWQVDLRRALVLMPFVFGLTGVQLGLLSLTGGAPPLGPTLLRLGLLHAAVNALAAPLVARLFELALGRLASSDALPASLRFEPDAPTR